MRVKFEDNDQAVKWFAAVDDKGKPFDRYTYLVPHAAYNAHEEQAPADVVWVKDHASLFAAHGL